MNELPRRKLLEIVSKYGRSVVERPRRLEGLLRDHCGEYRREISVLIAAVQEHAVSDLLAASLSLPREVLLARLAQRLSDNLALSADAARWSIESWALAFGVVSEKEIASDKPVQAAQNPVVQPGRGAVPAGKPVTAANVFEAKPRAGSYIVAAKGGDFASITEAVRAVAPNSRLTVREGIYNESVVIDKNVEIIGEGASEKIILRSTHASCLVMQTDQASVRGLTLQGVGAGNGKAFFAVEIPIGELVLDGCDIVSDSLSGVAVFGASAAPSIKNCRIHDCADSGLYIFDNASPRIENCDVYRNANASVAVTQGANPSIKNCRVFEGENGGVVVWGNGAAGLIEDCRIYGHRLANVGVSDHAHPTFRRCSIYGGRDTGVYVHQNGYGTFEECDVYRNAEAEIGISKNGNSVFRRCIVREGENSGFILRNQARAEVESCNIYDNRDAGIALYGESAAIVSRCNIHRNGKVAVRIKERSAARVENCDLRGNFLAAWETEHGIALEEINNRDN